MHLSAGDLLRKERDSGSETAELIEKVINDGKIVPVRSALQTGINNVWTAEESNGRSRMGGKDTSEN